MVQLSKPKSYYRKWVETEGIPIIDGHYVESLQEVDVFPWPRLGGLGVYINHEASDVSNDCYVAEIPPGQALAPQRHFFEIMIYVLRGRGATTVWYGTGPKRTFEWQAGSLFAIPLNAHYQHFNGQGTEPCRFLAVTNCPMVMNMVQSVEFVFGCDFEFRDRFNGEEDYFSGAGELRGRTWETNFVPDLRVFEGMLDYKERGAGGRNVRFRLAKNAMRAHISEFPVGTYKKGHRHGPGAHVVVVSGRGYSLMWREGEPIQEFPWRPGTLLIPPNQWFHQHFNTGPEPARYLALRLGGLGIQPERTPDGLSKSTVDRKLGGDQIEYEDEDPMIRQKYLEACAQNGVAVQMETFWQRPG